MLAFLKAVFSDGDIPSSSRVLSALCTCASIAWISHIVWHNHTMPDAVTVGGATAFSTAHYAANRLSNMIGKN